MRNGSDIGKLLRYRSTKENGSLVWKVSLQQAGDMVKEWSEPSAMGVTSTRDDTMTLALHVLPSAGFGHVLFVQDLPSEAACRPYDEL